MEQNFVNPWQWSLRILSIIWGLVSLPVSFMAVMSVTLFDAPGSENSFLPLLLFLSIATAPFVLLASCIGGLIVSFRKKRGEISKSVKVFAMLPLVNIVIFIFAWTLIDIVCNGKLAC